MQQVQQICREDRIARLRLRQRLVCKTLHLLYKISDVTMFMMPTAEAWMPYLRKWKNDCAGCPGGGALSCWSNTACY